MKLISFPWYRTIRDSIFLRHPRAKRGTIPKKVINEGVPHVGNETRVWTNSSSGGTNMTEESAERWPFNLANDMSTCRVPRDDQFLANFVLPRCRLTLSSRHLPVYREVNPVLLRSRSPVLVPIWRAESCISTNVSYFCRQTTIPERVEANWILKTEIRLRLHNCAALDFSLWDWIWMTICGECCTQTRESGQKMSEIEQFESDEVSMRAHSRYQIKFVILLQFFILGVHQLNSICENGKPLSPFHSGNKSRSCSGLWYRVKLED